MRSQFLKKGEDLLGLRTRLHARGLRGLQRLQNLLQSLCLSLCQSLSQSLSLSQSQSL